MDEEVFNYIKDWTIRYFKQHDNTHGYVDKKINEINRMKNDEPYSAMFILNMVHAVIRPKVMKNAPMSVLSYVTYHSEDLKDIIYDDRKLYKNMLRYRKIQNVLDHEK